MQIQDKIVIIRILKNIIKYTHEADKNNYDFTTALECIRKDVQWVIDKMEE